MAIALHIPEMNWVWPLVFVVPLLAIVVLSLFGARRHHRKVQALVASREAITDEEFLRRGGFSREDKALAIAVRDAMVDLALIPPETVYPDDTFGFVVSFDLDGWNMWHVKFRIEEFLQVRCPRGFWTPLLNQKKEYDLTIQEIAAHLIENRAKLIPCKKSRRCKEQ